MNFLNDAIIKGRLLNVFQSSDQCGILTISCGEGNIVKVVCFQECYEKCKQLHTNDYIMIVGNIQSSRKENKNCVAVFCNDIFTMDSTMHIYQNYFHVAGFVKNVVTHERKALIITATFTDGHYSKIPLSLYSNSIADIAPEKGVLIETYGHIESRKFVNDGNVEYQTLYVVDRMDEVQ